MPAASPLAASSAVVAATTVVPPVDTTEDGTRLTSKWDSLLLGVPLAAPDASVTSRLDTFRASQPTVAAGHEPSTGAIATTAVRDEQSTSPAADGVVDQEVFGTLLHNSVAGTGAGGGAGATAPAVRARSCGTPSPPTGTLYGDRVASPRPLKRQRVLPPAPASPPTFPELRLGGAEGAAPSSTVSTPALKPVSAVQRAMREHDGEDEGSGAALHREAPIHGLLAASRPPYTRRGQAVSSSALGSQQNGYFPHAVSREPVAVTRAMLADAQVERTSEQHTHSALGSDFCVPSVSRPLFPQPGAVPAGPQVHPVPCR